MSGTISTQAARSASGDPSQAAAGAEPVVLDARVFTGDLAQPDAFAVRAGRIHALGATTFAWVAIGRAVRAGPSPAPGLSANTTGLAASSHGPCSPAAAPVSPTRRPRSAG